MSKIRTKRNWFHVQAQDPDGVSRVFGEGNSYDEAYGQCKEAAREYLAGRKDIDRLLIAVGNQWTIITRDGVLV